MCIRDRDTYKQQYAGGMRSYTYAYDGNGNITHISLDGTLQSRYTYDAQNQLIREDNTSAGETTVYAYDNAGNLTSKTSYPYTTEDTLGTAASSVSYGYGNTAWKDQLTSWNGQTITYSPIGNPIQYRDGFSFLWQQGRYLTQLTKNGTTTAYTYDDQGLRRTKTVGGVRTSYYWNGNSLSGCLLYTSRCV